MQTSHLLSLITSLSRLVIYYSSDLDIHQLSLRGALPILLQNYFLDPSYRVRASNLYSSIHSQENGIPQGSPLSGTLFLIVINDAIKVIHLPIHPILFVDDLNIHLRSSYLQRTFRILQVQLTRSMNGLQLIVSASQRQKPSPLFSKNANFSSNFQIFSFKISSSHVDTVRFLDLRFPFQHSRISYN